MSSVSKANSDEKIGEFWDSHDFTEFDTDAPDASFEVTCTVPVKLELLNEIGKASRKARAESRSVSESLAAAET